MADNEQVGGAVIKLGIDSSEVAAQGARAAAAVGAAMDKAEKAQGRVTKQIQANIDRINSTKATASMQLLDQAVAQMGGRAKLNADQVARLTKEIDRLSAAGAKIPKTLALPAVGGAGAGLKGAATSALSGLGPGGAVGAGFAALGPGGLAAGAIVAGLGAITKGFIDQSDALDDLSKKTRLSIATLDAWGIAAKTSGVTAEQLAETSLKLSANIAQGDSVFERLGLRLEDLRKLTPEQQFEAVGQRILALKTPGEQAAAALETMGKSGTDALQALRDGFLDNLPAAKAHADAMEGARKDAAALRDNLDLLGAQWERYSATLASVVVPGMTAVLKVFNEAPAAILEALASLAEFRSKVPSLLGGGGQADKDLAGALRFQAAQVRGAAAAPAPTGATAGQFRSQAEIKAAEAAAKERKAAEEKAIKEIEDLREKAEKSMADLRTKLIRETIEAEKRAEAEIGALLQINLRVEQARLGTMQLEVQAAQAEANARANQVGTGESQADSRQQIIDAKTALDQRTAKQRELNTLLDEMARKGNLGQAQVAALRGELGLVGGEISTAKTATYDFSQALQDAGAAAQALGFSMDNTIGRMVTGFLQAASAAQRVSQALASTRRTDPRSGEVTGGRFGDLSTGQKVGAGIEGLNVVSSIRNQGQGGAKGALAGAAKGAAFGAAFGPYGAAIGAVAGGIIGAFSKPPEWVKAQKQAAKILGRDVPQEMAEQILAESKKSGKSVADVTKEIKRKEDRQKAIEARAKLEEGLNNFAAGLEQANTALKDVEKSPALEAALATLGGKLDEALGKAGLFRTPEALKESKVFGAAQTAAGGLAQAAAGARQAGVLDADVQKALSTAGLELQKQAAQAARDAGLGEKEAQRAGFGAVATLLREQLNAQLQSSGKVDAALQAQLDEAKANGIEILADPAIEQLNVAKEQLSVLEKGFGVVADRVDAAGQMQAAATAAAVAAIGTEKVGGPGAGSILDFPGAQAIPRPSFDPMGGIAAQIQAAQSAADNAQIGVLQDIRAALVGNVGPVTIQGGDTTVNIPLDPFAVNETRLQVLRAADEAMKTRIRNRDAELIALIREIR